MTKNTKYFLLILLLFSVIFCIEEPSKCPEKCPQYYHCDPGSDTCVHKGFFPLYPMELLELMILCISSALATACGVGGGGIYSAFFLGIQQFPPSKAFPVSNFLILACSAITFYIGVKDKQANPKNSFVDYDLAVIFGPSMLLGAKFGTILNKTFSSLILTVALVCLLVYSMNNTYRNAMKAKMKEQALELANESSESLNKLPLLKLNEMLKANEKSSHVDAQNVSNQKIEEENSPLRWDRIRYMIMFEIIVVIDQVLEGNSKVPSLVGITRCSGFYWVTFIAFICVNIYLVKYASEMIQKEYREKTSVNSQSSIEKMSYLQNNLPTVIAKTLLGGIIAGMTGVGGGMITNPIFLSMGLDPKAATSTSNFLITCVGLTGTIMFIFAGQLNIEFALCMMIPCTLSAFFGSRAILEHINKTRKSSFLLIILFYFLLGSMIIIVGNAGLDIYHSNQPLGIFTMKSYCN